ncbi:hypothetical protein FGG08_005527 [Glutinoglossum americanum]|uniref:Uncharacterized protein n=1 Tax=Glutinoglossum americanum TaxID=1670608 RepID=A0A9P8KYF3_9PEZI|nr:hypothetical protein FGG08_005527 [Glutinoglossum americanum]
MAAQRLEKATTKMSCRISIVNDIAATTFRLTKEEEAKILAVEPSQLQPIEEEFVSVFPTSPVAALCDAFRSLDSTYFENSLYGRTLIRLSTPNSQFHNQCPLFVSEMFRDITRGGEMEGPHMVFVIYDCWPQKPKLTIWLTADHLDTRCPRDMMKLLFRGLAQASYGMRHFCGFSLREWGD